MAAAVPKSGEVYYAEDGTVSIVLDDNFDPNYEPPQKEIAEYAKWLGIDPDNEKELLWIARDGLRAPLPKEWKPCKTDTGDVYYFNFKSGESIWDHPMDDVYKKKVEDERAKLKGGGGGGGKPTKLVKGGAGSTADAKPMSRTAIEEVRPKSGRLGAIGSSEEQKTQRPDISALLPTKSEQVASTLLGKKKEPLKDMKELERTLRKKFDSELEATRTTLQTNYDKQIQELKATLAAEQKKTNNNLKHDVEDEVDQAKRNGERRNKRELQLYVDSIDKQKEDLRRTLKSAQEKLDADTAGVNRRVESELSEKRSAAEKQLSLDIGRRRQEIQEAWQREKAHVEMQTQQKKHELQSAYELRVEQARHKELQALSKKAQEFEDQLLAELAAVKQQLASERAAHSERVGRDAKEASAGAAAAYNLANAEYQAAVAEAQRAADAAMAAERASAAQTTDQLQASIEQQKADARAQVHSTGQKNVEDRLASRRAFAATRIREAEADISRRFEEEKRQYEQETQRLEREALEQARASASQTQQGLQAALEQARQAAMAQRSETLNQMQDRHRRLLDTMRRDGSGTATAAKQNPRDTPEYRARLEEEKASWQRNHPAPVYHLPTLPDVPVFDPTNVKIDPIVIKREVEAPPTSSELAAVVQEEVARRRASMAPEWDHKLSELQRSLTATYLQEREAHRAKAVSEMEARLSSYRESGGSPLRAAKGRVAQQHAVANNTASYRPPTPAATDEVSQRVSHREADSQTAELRTVLQQRLDQLVAELSTEASTAAADVASAQRELQAITSSVGHSGGSGVPPRPHSAAGQYHQAMQRAQTADAAYFQTGNPSSSAGAVHAQLQQYPAPTRRSVTPSGAMPGSHQSTPSRRPRGSTFQERLAKAHDLLRRKKKEIKGRQLQLEDVRADWKRDMAAAKAAHDDDQVRTLKRVAEVLEADARNLNREAMALKESYQWLKSEGEGYYCEKHAYPHGVSSPHRHSRGTPTSGQPLGAPPGAETGDIGALLSDILRKADLVEHQVQRAETRRPSPGGPATDMMVNKWSTWLRRQPAAEVAVSRPSDGPTAIGGAGDPHAGASPKKRDVERWVTEQQRSFR